MLLFPSNTLKAKGCFFLHATEHVINFYSLGNLPRRYSRESRRYSRESRRYSATSAGSACSGFQKSKWRYQLPESQLLTMLFTKRPTWDQAIWLILCYWLQLWLCIRSKMLSFLAWQVRVGRILWGKGEKHIEKTSKTSYQQCWQ